MKLAQTLLQLSDNFVAYKKIIFCFITAFVVAMLLIPPLMKAIQRFKLYDLPNNRKEHSAPVPTMGGIAVCIAMAIACSIWFTFTANFFIISFFISILVLFVIGILDDMNDLKANYKFIVQLAVAAIIAFSGVRITSFYGILGIHELPVVFQYALTILAIAGITNAFNLIDGIDGLAGGLGFMSLVILGGLLTISKQENIALVAFALAGGLLGFLYYNVNPARIFMGDTGSLILGFVVSVLSIQLLNHNARPGSTLPHAPVQAISIVMIPVFDTLRVFSLRIKKGKSPFHPDKTHIHHLLTQQGWSHKFSSRIICLVHGIVLMLGYFLKDMRQEFAIGILVLVMLLTILVFRRLRMPAFNQ